MPLGNGHEVFRDECASTAAAIAFFSGETLRDRRFFGTEAFATRSFDAEGGSLSFEIEAGRMEGLNGKDGPGTVLQHHKKRTLVEAAERHALEIARMNSRTPAAPGPQHSTATLRSSSRHWSLEAQKRMSSGSSMSMCSRASRNFSESLLIFAWYG